MKKVVKKVLVEELSNDKVKVYKRVWEEVPDKPKPPKPKPKKVLEEKSKQQPKKSAEPAKEEEKKSVISKLLGKKD